MTIDQIATKVVEILQSGKDDHTRAKEIDNLLKEYYVVGGTETIHLPGGLVATIKDKLSVLPNYRELGKIANSSATRQGVEPVIMREQRRQGETFGESWVTSYNVSSMYGKENSNII